MITIIGGGISGITAGLTLQLLGCDTEIYAERLIGHGSNNDPRFASQYPAASVIPHSVHSDRLAALFADSTKVFKALYKNNFPGMQMHRHYEVYEFPKEVPEYTHFLKNYAPIDEVEQSFIPKRRNIDKLFGWAFDCYITEWPGYIKKIYRLYEEKGGKIYKTKVDRDVIKKLPINIVVNCSGVWAGELFEDTARAKIIRGHIIHALNKPKVRDSRGNICSYNYTPKPSVYATPEGEPCDVYFYPIGDKWLMGGSRQAGILEADGTWKGQNTDDTVTLDGIEVPAQILNLNNEILKNTYQTNIPLPQDLKSFIGYRFRRGGDGSGLRLESSTELGKTVVHNYGHGGAGVTLSWGCALQVARLMGMDAEATDVVKAL